jgi:hypothetical protein
MRKRISPMSARDTYRARVPVPSSAERGCIAFGTRDISATWLPLNSTAKYERQ